MMEKRYHTNCVNSTASAIQNMVDDSKEISRKTFLKHVDKDDLEVLSQDLGYALHHSQGLTMSRDWHIKYYKAEYKGKPCYYFIWSAIEYIFI